MSSSLRFVDAQVDHLPAIMAIRDRSFGYHSNREVWLKEAAEFVEDRRFFAVVDGDTVVAAARMWDFGQWWYGNAVPMAGVAGVVVAPEYRGRGVGSLLMRGVMERSRSYGFPISALYPATVVIYRQMGYEFGGARYRFTFDAAALRVLGGREVPVRRAGAEDAGRLLELVAQIRTAGRESGMLNWPEKKVREWLSDEEEFCYLADDGFVAYGWDGSDLRVDELIAGSEATTRALWSIVGSGSSIAESVDAYIGPHDPIHQLVADEASSQAKLQRWMMRILDAPAAITARGWSPDVSLEAEFEVADPVVSSNSGRWRLAIDGGSAELTPGKGSGPVPVVTARGLAALYAGTPLSTLRIAGLVTGDESQDTRLELAFAGSPPYMLDYF